MAEKRTIQIQGEAFEIADLYDAGHQLTEIEAKVLNQTRAENVRNNFAKQVKDAQGEDGKLPEGKQAELQTALDEYAASYVFSLSGGRITDPVQKEARRIATEILHGKIQEKGVAVSKYKEANPDKYNAALDKLMENEAVQKEAQKVVASKKKLGDNIEI